MVISGDCGVTGGYVDMVSWTIVVVLVVMIHHAKEKKRKEKAKAE